MDIKIKNMSLNDLENIKDILESKFDDFWNYNILKEELESKNSKYIVAFYKDEIVGFAGLKITCDEADIMNIVVKKAYRKKGIGTILFNNLTSICKENKIKTLFLEVNEDNSPAISLYKKMGFKQISVRKNYYKNKNGIVMSLNFFSIV